MVEALPPRSWRPGAAVDTTPPEGPDDFPASGGASLATTGERTVAKLLDLMVLAVPALVLVVPFIAVEGEEASLDQPLWASLALVGIFVVYDTVAVALWGSTLGKRVVGLRVARIVDGGRPDWSRSAIRVLLPASIAVIPVIGIMCLAVFLRAFVDPLRQGFHDMAAGTVVVRRD